MPNFRGTAGRITVSSNGTPVTTRLTELDILGGSSVVDAGGGKINFTPSGSGAPALWKAVLDVNFSDISPISFYLTGSNERVITTQVIVEEVFDGVNPQITVGDTTLNDRLFEADMCDLAQLDEYESNNQYLYSSPTQINIYLNSGGSTQGKATVLLQIQE